MFMCDLSGVRFEWVYFIYLESKLNYLNAKKGPDILYSCQPALFFKGILGCYCQKKRFTFFIQKSCQLLKQTQLDRNSLRTPLAPALHTQDAQSPCKHSWNSQKPTLNHPRNTQTNTNIHFLFHNDGHL